VVIEQDENGCYAWCPELKGCQSLETLTYEERLRLTSAPQVVLTTAIQVHA